MFKTLFPNMRKDLAKSIFFICKILTNPPCHHIPIYIIPNQSLFPLQEYVVNLLVTCPMFSVQLINTHVNLNDVYEINTYQ